MGHTHKNQHWIPKVYLKSWLDPDFKGKVVHRYNADGSYLDYRPISRIFSEDDLYTIRRPDGSRSLETEEGLQRLETYFDRARRTLERGGEFAVNHQTALVVFIAAMRNRSPASRDSWQGFLDRVTAVGENMERSIRDASPAKRRAMARSPMLKGNGKSIPLVDWKAAAAKPFGAWLLGHIGIEARHMGRMSLQILEAPAESFFITSDNPVVWWDAEPRPDGVLRRLGLGYKHLEVTMPLSPHLCALLSHSGDAGRATVNQEWVDHINMRTLSQCDRLFLSSSPNLCVDWHDVSFPAEWAMQDLKVS